MAATTQGTRQGKPVDKRETVTLIAAATRSRERPSTGQTATAPGRSECVMIDKVSGKVAYVVMSFGGFMGIGQGLLSPSMVAADVQPKP